MPGSVLCRCCGVCPAVFRVSMSGDLALGGVIMRLTVVVDVDCMGDERELYLFIDNGDHRSRVCFRVD